MLLNAATRIAAISFIFSPLTQLVDPSIQFLVLGILDVRDSWCSVANAAARIGEGLPCFGNELPIISIGMQCQLQDPECVRITDFAIRMRIAEGPLILTARASHKFADAPLGVGFAVGILESESLVVVVVSTNDDVGIRVVESLPKRFEFGIVAVLGAGAEQRLVKISQSAGGRMRGEICAEPFFFARTGITAADLRALAIQDDDVPVAQLITVEAIFRVSGNVSEILEIESGTSGMKFMIANCRPGASFEAAPSFIVAFEIFPSAIWIRQVADSHHRSWILIQ